MQNVWTISRNGLFRYITVTPYYVKYILTLMRDCYFKSEPTCKLIGLHKEPEAIRELDKLVYNILNDGISVVALEEQTGKVAGVLLNKIIVETKDESHKGNFAKLNFKHPLARKYNGINIAIDNSINCFELFQSNCYVEAVYDCIWPEFRHKTVAPELLQSTTQVAQCMTNGEDVRVCLTDDNLPEFMRPTGVLGISTTIATKMIMENYGYNTAKVLHLNDILNIGPSPLPVTLMYKLLKPVKNH